MVYILIYLKLIKKKEILNVHQMVDMEQFLIYIKIKSVNIYGIIFKNVMNLFKVCFVFYTHLDINLEILWRHKKKNKYVYFYFVEKEKSKYLYHYNCLNIQESAILNDPDIETIKQ